MLLKVAGYDVSVAASISEAIERARETHGINLIVTDYHLEGGETGIDAISSIRTILGSDVKAILVTGDTSSAVRELHRDEHLRLASKPIDADELLGLMGDLLAAK